MKWSLWKIRRKFLAKKFHSWIRPKFGLLRWWSIKKRWSKVKVAPNLNMKWYPPVEGWAAVLFERLAAEQGCYSAKFCHVQMEVNFITWSRTLSCDSWWVVRVVILIAMVFEGKGPLMRGSIGTHNFRSWLCYWLDSQWCWLDRLCCCFIRLGEK